MKQLLVIFLLFVSSILWGQDHFSKLKIEEDNGYDELSTFFGDSLLSNFSVFLTGENHAFAKTNSLTEYRFLIFLHETQGVNHFLFEQGPAIGYIINKITIEDDLDYAFYLEDRFYKPFFEMVKRIRDYNEFQPDSAKIMTHGIDVERYPAYAIFALNDIIDTLPTKGETGRIYESIKALGSSEFKDASPEQIYNAGGTRFNLNGNVIDAWSTFNTIIYDVNRLKDSLKVELGDTYPIFKDIIESIEKGHQWFHEEREGDLSGPITRERFMLDQFERLTKRYEAPKFYGQFGRCHLHSDKKAKRCYSYDMSSIAKRIGEMDDPLFKGKVLAIPVLYEAYNSYERQMIESLNLDYRFEDKNEVYLIDINYLKGDNPLAGFSNSLPYIIVNTHPQEGFSDEYNFNFGRESVHFGLSAGLRYLNKLNTLNFELGNVGSSPFATTQTFYEIGFDYYDMNVSTFHLSYMFVPEISNGDRFTMRQSLFSFGNAYPFGNDWFIGAIGLNYTFGTVYLKETKDAVVPNLIQVNGENITIYKNDIFYLDPYLEARLMLPVISLNAKVGYAFDVSGKYWIIDSKIKDFTKTSFTSAYFTVGASFHFDSSY
ncbi:MAG: hypothetical protein R3279_06580 [Putridiphycobacter sp.]|nr:hypothetical protein [Putridiphycobacter sp.]